MRLSPLIQSLNVTGLLLLASLALAGPPSTQPEPRSKQFSWMSLSSWYERHAADVALAEQGRARIVFLGDSITQGWDPQIWQQHLASLGAVNFGIGGDLTQNILWRLEHGDVENLDPELVVVMAGVNNYLHNKATPADTFLGVKAVVDKALASYPNARLILQGILPFGQQPNTPERHWVAQTNALLQQLGQRPRVTYYDFGDYFLAEDGRISTEIMADFIHPSRAGYAIWIEHLLPAIEAELEPAR